MPSKKNKGDEEPLKPLGHYVKDRLEMTKQLFSCLKKKQIKSRLPINLQSKSIERIQQICLEELLGISTKRLLSIINNTICPDYTDSDSEIEHISLSEISSDSDIEEISSKKQKEPKEKQTTKTAEEPPKKSEKEMTMLELLELQARARAIRSQLALEPVTKIELDSDDDEQSATNQPAALKNPEPSKPTAKVDKRPKADESKKKVQLKAKSPEKAKINSKKDKPEPSTSKEASRKSNDKNSPEPNRRVVIVREKSIENIQITCADSSTAEPTTKKSSPIKLKRNFRGTELEGYPLRTVLSLPPIKEKTPPKELDESRSSSPDIITMEQNIATYFISDSDDEEPPPKKKSPSPKIIVQSVEIINPVTITSESQEQSDIENKQMDSSKEDIENMEANDKNSQKSTVEEVMTSQNESEENENNNRKTEESTQDEDDENIINIMSDTEIDLNVNSDKEDDEEQQESQNSTQNDEKEGEKSKQEEEMVRAEAPVEENALTKQVSSQSEYDYNVVEIHTSDDEIAMDSSEKPASDGARNSDESETWQQRYTRSSKIQDVLKTTKLATKVREKIVQNKKSARIAKKDKEKEKEVNERMSKLEEGSLEQFQVLKESSTGSNL